MQKNAKTALNPGLRRCAAYMALAEVLQGDELMSAMWILEERDQTADKTTFISFFGVTAELLGIKSSVITNLYSKLNHNLKLAEPELAKDPMPQMLKFRGMDSATLDKEPNKIQSVQTENKLVSKKKGSPEMTVFVALISSIATEAGYPKSQGYDLFIEVLKEELQNIALDDGIAQQLNSWAKTLSIKVFKQNFSKDQLQVIVHCLYIALCEAVGPVKADGILNQAINQTSKLAVARLYSPKNFL